MELCGFEEGGLYLNIRSFEKLPGNALVLCANQPEFQHVMETIHDRNKKRREKSKFKFEMIKKGSGIEVSGNIRDFVGGKETGRFNRRQIVVVDATDDVFARLYLMSRKAAAGGGFSMVQLRGHTEDMEPLFRMSREFQAPACFLSLGGCEGTQFIKKFYRPERPVAVERDIGTTVSNTHLLVRYFDELGSGKHASWAEFHQELARTSKNVSSGRIIVPGDPNYRKYL